MTERDEMTEEECLAVVDRFNRRLVEAINEAADSRMPAKIVARILLDVAIPFTVVKDQDSVLHMTVTDLETGEVIGGPPTHQWH